MYRFALPALFVFALSSSVSGQLLPPPQPTLLPLIDLATLGTGGTVIPRLVDLDGKPDTLHWVSFFESGTGTSLWIFNPAARRSGWLGWFDTPGVCFGAMRVPVPLTPPGANTSFIIEIQRIGRRDQLLVYDIDASDGSQPLIVVPITVPPQCQ